MQRDVLVAGREEVAECRPAGAALAALAEAQVVLGQPPEERRDAGPVVPQDDRPDLHATEVLEGSPVAGLVGAVEGDEDRVEVGELRHLVADPGERGPFELRDEARDEQGGARLARVARDRFVELDERPSPRGA